MVNVCSTTAWGGQNRAGLLVAVYTGCVTTSLVEGPSTVLF